MDIWSLADSDQGVGTDTDANKANTNAKANMLDQDEDSSTVMVVGDAGCGKSTLIQTFLKPNATKEPKSTFALEYAFARRKNAEKGNNKTLAHIWELGGDIYEPKLLSVPLTLSNLPSAAVIIVLDLSKPGDCFASMKRWLTAVREHLNARYIELKSSGSHGASLAHGMKDRATSAYNSSSASSSSSTGKASANDSETPAAVTQHADISRVRISEVPILIIANKNDLFRNKHPSGDRRTLLQTLRFAAHYHGASLLVTSSTDNSNKEVFRGFMNSLCFGVNMKPVLEVASDRTVIVTAGKDLFVNILTGKSAGKGGGEEENSNAKSVFASSEADVNSYITASGVSKETWNRFETTLMSVFGSPGAAAVMGNTSGSGSGSGANENGSSNTSSRNEYPEADIDDARSARDMVLEQYIQDASRREKLSARSASGSGSGSGGGAASNDDNANNDGEELSSASSRDRGDRDRDRGGYGTSSSSSSSSNRDNLQRSDTTEVDDRRKIRK